MLDDNSPAEFNCPIFRQLANFRAKRCWRCVEDLARATIYPYKTKPTGAFKKLRQLVATQMHCDGNMPTFAKVDMLVRPASWKTKPRGGENNAIHTTGREGVQLFCW